MKVLSKTHLFACITALVLLVSLLAACGGAAAPASSAAPAASSAAAGEPAVAEPAVGGYRVAMITNAPINDGGWNTACYSAMTEAAAAAGWETAYTENVAQADYVPTMSNYAMQGFNLVIAPGNEFTDAVKETAETYPDTYFLINNGEFSMSNVSAIMPDNHMIGFLAGCVAGLQTETNSVGFVGGIEIPTCGYSRESYAKGVAYVNPDCEIVNAMAGSFDDTAKGKEIALSMVSTNNCDVIFGLASAVDTGIRAALAENENRWNIAQPADLLDDAPDIIVTSVVTSTAKMYEIGMHQIEDGTFSGETIYGDLNNECLSLGRYADFFSADDKAKMDEILAGLKDGSIAYK